MRISSKQAKQKIKGRKRSIITFSLAKCSQWESKHRTILKFVLMVILLSHIRLWDPQ